MNRISNTLQAFVPRPFARITDHTNLQYAMSLVYNQRIVFEHCTLSSSRYPGLKLTDAKEIWLLNCDIKSIDWTRDVMTLKTLVIASPLHRRWLDYLMSDRCHYRTVVHPNYLTEEQHAVLSRQPRKNVLIGRRPVPFAWEEPVKIVPLSCHYWMR